MTRTTRTYSRLSRWLRHQGVLASLVVFVCASSVRLFTALRADTNELLVLYPDSTTYLAPAQNLIHKEVFLDSDGNPMVSRTPGYPGFLAFLAIAVGEDLHRMLMLQAFLLAFTVSIFYRLATKVLPPAMAFTAAIAAAFSPWGAVLAGIPLSDGLFL